MTSFGVDIRNPYASTTKWMSVSSDPLTHHRVVGGDFAIDVNMPGMQDAGEEVAFDAAPTGTAREVRGVVTQGGLDPWFSCRNGEAAAGGMSIRLRVEVMATSDEWEEVGMFALLHLEDFPEDIRPGKVVLPGTRLGRVTGNFDGHCSTGPHLHCEAGAVGGLCVPMVRGDDRLSEASVLFSIGKAINDQPGPERSDHRSQLPEAARVATSLSEYYRAMGQTLPRVDNRSGIFAELRLGAAANYRGTADQNLSLLRALKEREIAPRSVADLS